MVDKIVGCAERTAIGQHDCFLLPAYPIGWFQIDGIGFREVVVSGSCLMADVSCQNLFVSESGSDAGGICCVSTTIIAHIDN